MNSGPRARLTQSALPHEPTITFSHSSGPGGQNVNKTSTKATLHWSVGKSAAFTDEQKNAIRAAAGKRLSQDDEIVLYAEDTRSQSQNRALVIARLEELIARALAPRKTRKPTRVSRTQKRKRLEGKRLVGEKKKLRKSPRGEW